MKKKKRVKFKLDRTTIRRLAEPRMGHAVGGTGWTVMDRFSCEGMCASDGCQTDYCADTAEGGDCFTSNICR